ncbi:MAG: saccharopine dehydrogenase NADP-binding domain-containing protein [Proteobacteria bacterium]|nr:saccharopine dehydrogenase NADP-binding domain-containing protein [Pseudomonadota bacterium]
MRTTTRETIHLRNQNLKEFDVVVFGATSFVGKILTQYLCDRYEPLSLRWAIAARSTEKLQALSREFNLEDRQVPWLVADSHDESALRTLCERTKVVISTVGPYALYGETLVRVCAESGTDYCDLTGEVQWIRRMLDRYESVAKQSGARIVHCCGFDSIPSDLGVYAMQKAATQRFGMPCTTISMRVKAMRGGFSGGTAASLLNVAKEAGRDPALRRELANPFSICPATSGARQPRIKGAVFDRDFNVWTTPFIMAGINTRIVHRSNALLDHAYSSDFRYSEAVMTGRGFKGRLAASTTALGLSFFMLASAFSPTRALLERFVLPKPGNGPSPQAQLSGFFDLRFIGHSADGRRLRGKVTGDRDPGYGSTAKMIGEAAACLAFDIPQTADRGGFWTPASLLGQALIDRLERHAGLKFEINEE